MLPRLAIVDPALTDGAPRAVTLASGLDAVTQVIEPVHYDYALALKPWAEIFGPEALILRSYDEASRHDDSLYRDFLSLFGVELPDDGVSLPLIDPNPRMDDSTLELVRMMQNAGIPKDVIDWTVIRSQKFNERQQEDAGAPAGDFAQVRSQAVAGLENLQALIPGAGPDLVGTLGADLPRPEPETRATRPSSLPVMISPPDHAPRGVGQRQLRQVDPPAQRPQRIRTGAGLGRGFLVLIAPRYGPS